MTGGPVAAGSPWSAQQRRWLQALGHVVYRHGEAAEAPAAVAAATVPSQRPEPVPAQAHDLRERARPSAPPPAWRDDAPRRAPSLDDGAVPTRTPAGATDATADAAPGARPGPAARRMPRLPDRLQLAMLRASGLDPSDPAAQAAMAQWPVEQLRNDPAAKRAFWPQLRALRKRP